MVETGAKPEVSWIRSTVSRVGRALTTPLLPDDYFALIRPRWSTRELTGEVIRVHKEADGAATIVVKPDFAWKPHVPGQYLRIGMEINGIRHWRAYTITSDPDHAEGVVSITVKHTEGGRMSPVFTREVRPGRKVFLGEIEGEFMLPDPQPKRMLFISAGSGVTPIHAMLRELHRRGALDETDTAVHVHSARSADDVIFGPLLRRLDERHEGYRLIEVHTGDGKRFEPADLDEHCPDWREREVFLSGPPKLIEAVEEAFEEAELADHLHTERFQPVIGNGGGEGAGGTVHFRVSDCETECGPGVSILVGGEEAGAKLAFGCRMGICHTCVGRLKDGAIRDIRTGAITEASGQMVRICINAPEGHVEVDL
jgi:ferredoxin-NADP reductase